MEDGGCAQENDRLTCNIPMMAGNESYRFDLLLSKAPRLMDPGEPNAYQPTSSQREDVPLLVNNVLDFIILCHQTDHNSNRTISPIIITTAGMPFASGRHAFRKDPVTIGREHTAKA